MRRCSICRRIRARRKKCTCGLTLAEQADAPYRPMRPSVRVPIQPHSSDRGKRGGAGLALSLGRSPMSTRAEVSPPMRKHTVLSLHRDGEGPMVRPARVHRNEGDAP